nr:SEL1-like repeat protein [Paraglaciecola sp. G1-23]
MTAPVFSADIFKTDKQFAAKQYKLAKQGYTEAAKVGNPHAYYQLATMYQKGLGVEKDTLNALIYMSMAADYPLEKAQTTFSSMMAPFNDDQKTTIYQVLKEHKQKAGKAIIQEQYFPVIKTENLADKVTFNGELAIDGKFFSEEYEDALLEFDEGSFTNDDGDLEEGDSLTLIMSAPKLPFLILDHDIASDGSKRNLIDIQKMGSTLTIKDEYALFPTPIPMFKDQPVEFVHRAYMGAATYSKFTMVHENEAMYENIIRSAKRLKSGTSLSDQYQYAMALQSFTWLTQEEGEVDKRLLALSKQGHPLAMFEHGLKLYREQNDIPKAIEWISLAASYGLANAEYRLGKLLTTSPWVTYDEKKALFWFESAVKKGHIPATLKTIELNLTANDKSLHDQDRAEVLLDRIAAAQTNNPEYFYLLALSHKNRENRDYTQVITNLEKAIFMAQIKNWDTEEWQDLLAKLTQGSVTIVE